MVTAVIGAGLAGLTVARQLAAAGQAVRVFERSRGFGGRLATRRTETAAFDHGAQYFTVQSEAFRDTVAGWREAGLVLPWSARFVEIGVEGTKPARESVRYVAVPGMNCLGRALTEGLTVMTQSRAVALTPTGDSWRITLDNGETYPADTLVLAMPAPQAVTLLEGVHRFAAQLAKVQYASCWSVMLRVEEGLDPGWDGAFVSNGGPLSWLANNRSKPGRNGDPAWVAHASPAWSDAHRSHAQDWVAQTLLRAAGDLLGGTPLALESVHRWLYARVSHPLGEPYLWDEMLRLGICGDGMIGERVESAFLSGYQLAERMLRG